MNGPRVALLAGAMKHSSLNKCFLFIIGTGLLSIAFTGCGAEAGRETNSAGMRNNSGGGTPSTSALGGFNLKCKGKQNPGYNMGQQSKQSSFQQRPSCSPGKQVFEFAQQKVSDFDFEMDCASNTLVAQSKWGGKQASIPIQQDGKVKGGMQYTRPVQSDGKGHQQCFVVYDVGFDGYASCGNGGLKQGLSINTQVAFAKAEDSALTELADDPILSSELSSEENDREYDRDYDRDQDRDRGHERDQDQDYGRNRDRDRDQEHDYGRHHDRDRDQDQDQHHDYRPYPRPIPQPRPAARTVCVVENPCPIVTKTDLDCPDETGSGGGYGSSGPSDGPTPNYPTPSYPSSPTAPNNRTPQNYPNAPHNGGRSGPGY